MLHTYIRSLSGQQTVKNKDPFSPWLNTVILKEPIRRTYNGCQARKEVSPGALTPPQDTARALPALPPHFVAPKQIGDWKSLDKPVSLEKNFD